MSNEAFREIKRTIAGEERIYDCEPVAVTQRLAVVRYVFTRPLTAGGRTFEAGGWTDGFFWRSRNYNLYHIFSRDGEPIADRFDVIDHVRISPVGVRYDDLLLDVWLYPEGRIVIEDEEEVQEALVAGQLSQARLALIRRTERLLVAGGRRIVDRAVRELEALRRA